MQYHPGLNNGSSCKTSRLIFKVLRAIADRPACLLTRTARCSITSEDIPFTTAVCFAIYTIVAISCFSPIKFRSTPISLLKVFRSTASMTKTATSIRKPASEWSVADLLTFQAFNRNKVNLRVRISQFVLQAFLKLISRQAYFHCPGEVSTLTISHVRVIRAGSIMASRNHHVASFTNLPFDTNFHLPTHQKDHA